MRDLQHGIRALLRDKGFSLTVILTLAICVMANTATFAIVNSVLLLPLPLPDADRIVLVGNRYPKATNQITFMSSGGDYVDRQKGVTALESQALFRYRDRTIEINGSPEQIDGLAVTASFFSVTRVQPAVGRPFTEADEAPGQNDKVILTAGLATELFGSDSAALSRTLRVSGTPFTVVGVMPRDFRFPGPESRFILPLSLTPEEKQGHHNNNWFYIGRLRPGATIAQVQSQVDAINSANLTRFPEFRDILINAGFHSVAEPFKLMLVRQIEGSLYLLWGGALCVLLIGAFNLANLSLARFSSRSRDIATRLALGAGTGQLWRALTVEHLLLALAGGLAGLLAGDALLRVLSTGIIAELPRAAEVRIDAVTVAVALGLSALTGLIMGAAPITGMLRMRLAGTLRDAGNRTGTTGKQARGLRQLLVVAEVAFAFVLLLGAGLLLVSFRNILKNDPGFRAENVVTASVNIVPARYKADPEIRTFINTSLEAIRRIPGVTAAGATDSIPLGGNSSDSVIFAEGYQFQRGESIVAPKYLSVSPGYFEAMRIPLVRGRYITEQDRENTLPVIVIDERLAKRFWPNADPIGRRMYQPEDINAVTKVTPKTRMLTVVGVVRPVRLDSLTEALPVGAYYFPFAQQPTRNVTLAVQTSAATNDVVRALRAEVRRIDPQMAIYDVKTMTERTDLAVASKRAAMLLATGFGGIALLLSAIGIYGVLAYTVVQRTREIGIRVALGSTGSGVVQLVLREGLIMLGAGLVLGIGGALALQSYLEREVYGVRALEPAVLIGAAAVLGIIALAACVLPARRAVRLDVVQVLNG